MTRSCLLQLRQNKLQTDTFLLSYHFQVDEHLKVILVAFINIVLLIIVVIIIAITSTTNPHSHYQPPPPVPPSTAP